jgi:hypothetical protein
MLAHELVKTIEELLEEVPMSTFTRFAPRYVFLIFCFYFLFMFVFFFNLVFCLSQVGGYFGYFCGDGGCAPQRKISIHGPIILRRF